MTNLGGIVKGKILKVVLHSSINGGLDALAQALGDKELRASLIQEIDKIIDSAMTIKPKLPKIEKLEAT